MADTSDDCMRQNFLDLIVQDEAQNKTLRWGQNRFRYMEQIAKHWLSVMESRDQRMQNLQTHLGNRNETIDRLEAEIKRLNDELSSDSTSLESGEEIHQQRRRERMLDEVTLICVRDGIERMGNGDSREKRWGKFSRETADNICHGINDFDATH